MTIIPYTRQIYLSSVYCFKTLTEAANWAYQQMIDKPDDCSTHIFRFRIVDTGEDFDCSFSKKDGDILMELGWMNLVGFNEG